MTGYKVIKTTMGRRFWVKMDEDEIRERKIYRAVVVMTPLVMIFSFALAAGMIRWG